MELKIKKIKKILEYLFFFLWFLFEELVVNSAKKLLLFIKNFHFYEKMMQFIQNSNDFVLLFSFVFIVILAETSATIGVFVAAKGFVITGIVFYILKIIIYIPSIDIFKRNKNRLMKYKIIQFGYFLYEKIEKNPIFLEFKKKLKKFREYLKSLFKPFKEKFVKFWEKILNR